MYEELKKVMGQFSEYNIAILSDFNVRVEGNYFKLAIELGNFRMNNDNGVGTDIWLRTSWGLRYVVTILRFPFNNVLTTERNPIYRERLSKMNLKQQALISAKSKPINALSSYVYLRSLVMKAGLTRSMSVTKVV
jgi:hypothetical protein